MRIRLLLAGVLVCQGAIGQGLPQALFEIKEIDLHLHAGMEREVDLDAWLDMAVKDGRRVVALVDHLELYRKTEAEYREWRADRRFAEYPLGSAGHRAVMAEFARAAGRKDVITFRGWEIYEGELDTGFETDPMRMADVIGWHISPNHGGEPPDGRKLIRRARQILEAQKQFPIPMVLFHPFTMRLEHLQRAAQKKGRDPKSLTAAEYRFFRPGEQDELIRALKGTSVYIEISRSTGGYFRNTPCREALIADIRPLADAGLQFTISTDNHSVASAEQPFEPIRYCEALGITPANTNGIIRELLTLRAKAGLVYTKH